MSIAEVHRPCGSGAGAVVSLSVVGFVVRSKSSSDLGERPERWLGQNVRAVNPVNPSVFRDCPRVSVAKGGGVPHFLRASRLR